MDLNVDVITEILTNLPVKSVLRFKSVCKSWCSIIDSSAFRKSHMKNQSKNNNDDDDILFLHFSRDESTFRKSHLKNQSKNNNDDDDILFLHFSRENRKTSRWELSSTLSMQDNIWKLGKDHFPPPFHEFLNVNSWNDLIVCGPIDGLICMYDYDPIKDDRLGYSTVSIAICNPCLGESKILPLSPVLLDSLIGCSEEWAKRPFKYRIVGFGFDSATKDYKVVQVIWSLNGRAYVEVYSGRKNTWRVVDTDDIFDGRRWSFLECIQLIKTWYKSSGAAVYWCCRNDFDEVILSFNMQNEVFETIRLPEIEERGLVFAKDDDFLFLFGYSVGYRQLEVWELEIAGKKRGWTHVRDVNIAEFRGAWALNLWKYGVVCCDAGEDLVFYDYSTGRVRKRVELPVDIWNGWMTLEYKCTLNSLEIALN